MFLIFSLLLLFSLILQDILFMIENSISIIMIINYYIIITHNRLLFSNIIQYDLRRERDDVIVSIEFEFSHYQFVYLINFTLHLFDLNFLQHL